MRFLFIRTFRSEAKHGLRVRARAVLRLTLPSRLAAHGGSRKVVPTCPHVLWRGQGPRPLTASVQPPSFFTVFTETMKSRLERRLEIPLWPAAPGSGLRGEGQPWAAASALVGGLAEERGRSGGSWPPRCVLCSRPWRCPFLFCFVCFWRLRASRSTSHLRSSRSHVEGPGGSRRTAVASPPASQPHRCLQRGWRLGSAPPRGADVLRDVSNGAGDYFKPLLKWQNWNVVLPRRPGMEKFRVKS